jgi:DNA-binding transcriptional LysR family regulator
MRRFSLAQLEAFIWISRLGTFHAAAERLNLTQPSISLRIRDLETALGAKLFERRGNGMRLSAEGTILLQYAERGLAIFDELEERLRTGDPLQGRLRLGASDTFALTCLPDFIRTLEVTYPKLRVELTVANSTALANLLNHKTLDLAFMTDPRLNRSVTVEPIGQTDVAWMSSPGRRIGNGPLRPRDVTGANILIVPPPSPIHTLITDWCTADGSPAPAFSTCNNIAVIARLILSGVAMSVLPVCVVRKELEAGELVRYEELPKLAPRTICAAYSSSSRGPGIDALLSIARCAIRKSGSFDVSKIGGRTLSF